MRFLAFAALCLVPISLVAQDQDKPEKWDITQPFGPADTVRYEVTEGTWMNVDVSPDGRTIVFDLLGDVYTMPIGGGRASRIMGGLAFDMQPRFSPDGSKLAFISDRDGNFNLWLADPNGENATQVSKEDSREVNSPAWSPDGEYVFVRKHFVEQRSLGAGEVWMYHRSGGSGLQVTQRNGWQKDQGEPALSPDGRYLYYSRDVTSGQTFQYNKDPYAGIYAILRRDLSDGDERTVIGGPGGAITPRPSPDGKTLAFIRRVRYNTVLYLRDLETGREWPVWDGLSRDMQEAWAIHGVYAQYAWTPDGSAIIVWGKGRIWRVDVTSGTASEIPFTAQVEQTVHHVARFAQDVHPGQFRVRMLRDVATSPDGRMVAYSAMGHLYVKQMPSGAPRRVTADAWLEFDPAFSADGQWLVYTTWSDSAKGRVRVVRTTGRNGRDVVTRPGHYTEASFSPTGQQIVYRSVGGDGARGPTFAEHRGVFVVPVAGGEPRLVTENGSNPMFDHTGARIYLSAGRNDKNALISVDLNGGDEIVHVQSDDATQIVPSPDGKWFAFTERYHAYIAAFPRTGRAVDFSPSTRSYPVTRVSRDAGAYLHWSGDSQRLHWTMGPDYYTRDLTESFTFLPGAADSSAAPEAEGVDIGFNTQSDVPTGTVAFVGARVITMAESAGASGGVIESGTVVVEQNRIVAVVPSSPVTVPPGAFRVDASGKTIIPGIIDVHAHVGSESNGILAEANPAFMANVAYGVTTSHDPSNSTEIVFTNAEMIRAGMKLGPRLFSTGTILYGAETDFKAVVKTYEDALMHLRRQQAAGAFSVKSYNQRRRDARQMVMKAAYELEMMVVPEGGSLLYNNLTMVLDGHTGVEHSLPAPDVHADVARLFGASGTGYTPTMIVGYGGLSGEFYWYERTDVWEKEHLLTFTPRQFVDARSRRRLKAAGDEDFNHILIGRGAKAILDAGGLVQLGAHGQLDGLGAHWELWMFAQGGMTPIEALRVATLNGAKYLGLDGDLGSLEVGKLADLVVLDRNPLTDITNTEYVSQVMLNGRLYDAKTLNEIGNHPRARRKLYWEW
jgi:imidazolonepropionase-like amidohydrolase/Tol biopolymer transport system component